MRPESFFSGEKPTKREVIKRTAATLLLSGILVSAQKDEKESVEIYEPTFSEYALFILDDPTVNPMVELLHSNPEPILGPSLPYQDSNILIEAEFQVFENARLAEEKRLIAEEEVRRAEEVRVAEEQRLAEERRIAAQAQEAARASAASAGGVEGDTVWDRLAVCEATSNWQINTGNGYYGGLQMDMDFWSTYGGFEFAERPDLATREQQIIVAERGRDSGRGYNPWPGCSDKLGLR